jgi:hypothetical protein
MKFVLEAHKHIKMALSFFHKQESFFQIFFVQTRDSCLFFLSCSAVCLLDKAVLGAGVGGVDSLVILALETL